jgi:hypothetical protein
MPTTHASAHVCVVVVAVAVSGGFVANDTAATTWNTCTVPDDDGVKYSGGTENSGVSGVVATANAKGEPNAASRPCTAGRLGRCQRIVTHCQTQQKSDMELGRHAPPQRASVTITSLVPRPPRSSSHSTPLAFSVLSSNTTKRLPLTTHHLRRHSHDRSSVGSRCRR